MTRPRWLILVATVAAAALTARLGWWQLDRADQKSRWYADVLSRSALPPLAQAELARDPPAAALQHHRSIRLSGRWLHRHTVFLDNRQMNGRPGFFVVTPLELAPGDAVVVQRGWMPRDAADRSRTQPLPEAPGRVELRGQIAPPPSKLIELGEAGTGAIRQNLDLADYARETGLALRPLSVRQLDGPDAPADGLRRDWLVPSADVGKHHGYAFQWFALSALIIGLYVWFQLIHPRRVGSS